MNIDKTDKTLDRCMIKTKQRKETNKTTAAAGR